MLTTRRTCPCVSSQPHKEVLQALSCTWGNQGFVSLRVLAQGQTTNHGREMWAQAVWLHRLHSYELHAISVLNLSFSTSFWFKCSCFSTLYRNHVNQLCYWVPIMTELCQGARKLTLKLLQNVESKYKVLANKIVGFSFFPAPPAKAHSGTTHFLRKKNHKFT